jgi:Protein of unknown function (DUF2934)
LYGGAFTVWSHYTADRWHHEKGNQMDQANTNSEREQAIRTRAYFIWVNEGRPEGKDLEHWQQAEQEIPPTADSLSGEA